MSYPDEVKRIAYALDPGCWVSYSGAPIEHKRAIDARRSEALRRAEAQHEREHEQREFPIDLPCELSDEEAKSALLALIDHLGLRAVRRGGLISVEHKED